MIKKLQALKAKKGFTLVELIVVIAIIGVLAAILVPTMLGYVTSSRVTSCNSTASSLKNTVNAWLTDVDTKGYATDKSKDETSSNDRNITISANTSGEVSITFNGDIWSSTASAKADDLGTLLADKLEADMTLSNAYAVCYFNQGKVMSVIYGTGATSAPEGVPGAGDFAGGTFAWSDTDGITTNGDVVGTSPQLIKALFDDAGAGDDAEG